MDQSNIPIDIHAHKLLDWLVSRRHVNKDWIKPLTEIRNKVRTALEDMPEDEGIARLLSSGAQLNYFTCKQIFHLLKKTEADSKNIFGFYSSQRMKDWQEIINLYEKDNVFLAEAAQIIHRNVSFEIPSLKKQLAKIDNMMTDLKRQETEALKKSNHLSAERVKDLESLGISNDQDPAKQISSQLDVLPDKLQEIHSNLLLLKDVFNYYHRFIEVTQEKKERVVCPLLNYFLSKGNTTYFEYLYGLKPVEVILEKHLETEGEGNNGEEDVIDFGDDDGGIDFGDTEESASTTNGTGSNASDGFVHVQESDVESRKESVEEINWGEENAAEVIGGTNRVARGKEALSVLETRVTRDLLVHELQELEGFLLQRIFESSSTEEGSFLEVTMTSLLSSFQDQDLSEFLSRVQFLLSLLSNDRLKVLLQIKDNPTFIENLVKKLKLKKELSEKSLKRSEEMKEKQHEILEEKQKIAQQVPSLISLTRNLEECLEEAISLKYKNRPVNIMAGAQAL